MTRLDVGLALAGALVVLCALGGARGDRPGPGQAATSPPLAGPRAVVASASADATNDRVRRRLWRSFSWTRSTPEAEGLDSGVLARYLGDVRSGAYGDVHSLLVVRHGHLVLEEYFAGYSASMLHPVYSVTKSVTSCLFGIADNESLIPDLEAPLLSYFPDYSSPAHLDNRKRSIRLADVLAMQAGFDWDESSYPYTDPRNPVAEMSASPDWVRFVLDRPMADQPGTRFRYNTGCSVLLGRVLRRATGLEVDSYAALHLFGPLGIHDLIWERGAQGITNTGFGLHLRPLDMARLGLLVLNGGEWMGRHVISSDWLQLSTARRVLLSNGFGYGYQWWQMPLAPGATTPDGPDITIAWGWGGQFVFVVPSLDVVVGSTAGDYDREYEGAINFVREMLRDAVIR